MIAEYRPNRILRLERNPYFSEWSKAAQPDGYPDRIVLTLGGTADEAIDDVIRGRADLMSTLGSGSPTPRRLGAIKTRYASQVHTNPAQQTANLFLNTRVAPFNRLDVRRAVSYASTAPRRSGSRAAPTSRRRRARCFPHYPGYRRYCPYTAARPRRGMDGPRPRQGTTTRDPLRHARHGDDRLGLRSRGRLRPLAGDGPRSLGYRTSLKTLAATYNSTAFDSRSKAQIGFYGWGTDYPRLRLVHRRR